VHIYRKEEAKIRPSLHPENLAGQYVDQYTLIEQSSYSSMKFPEGVIFKYFGKLNYF